MGNEEWHVALIVGLLPTLLHLSLFLFLVGLVILLFSLDYAITTVVLFIAIMAYTAYVVTNLLPVWYPLCPYKTPLSAFAFILIHSWTPVLKQCLTAIQRTLRSKRPSRSIRGYRNIGQGSHSA